MILSATAYGVTTTITTNRDDHSLSEVLEMMEDLLAAMGYGFDRGTLDVDVTMASVPPHGEDGEEQRPLPLDGPDGTF